MSGLNIEGVKEAIPAPVEIETIAQVESAPEVAIHPSRWGHWLFWLAFIALFGLLAFGVMFPERIPSQLLDTLPEALRSLLFSLT